MKCPFCSHLIAEEWQPVHISTSPDGKPVPPQGEIAVYPAVPPGFTAKKIQVALWWAQCKNTGCSEIIVRVTRTETASVRSGLFSGLPPKPESWFAVPRKIQPEPIDPAVPSVFANDFQEAYRILDDSPRMAAALARRILADLLEQYAGLKQFHLADRIEAFRADPKHPSGIRENLHYVREIGNFAAHQMKDSEDRIIAASLEETRWVLEVISRLFDYFIIGPKKDESMRAAFDEKLKAANRKPIKPIPEN